MINTPSENRERFQEADLKASEAAKATPEKSVAALAALLESKHTRMNAYNIPETPKAKEQFPIVQRSVDARLELINSMVV